MSINGDSERSSIATQVAAMAAAAPNGPSVRSDAQPHLLPSLSHWQQTHEPGGQKRGRCHADLASRAGQDFGTTKHAATAAIAMMIAGNQNSQCQNSQ
ncbi:hypothetical protein [Streptomyces sp. NPDC017991]|uniref:hypothetical protein n=1 Tax=Streptomyces sp. NPDC017991 TaxID=3365026 RepID=UPI00379E8173